MGELADQVQRSLVVTLSPYVGKVIYGNLRFDVSTWDEQGHRHANIAIVYETPGSSTNQINVTVDETTKEMIFVDGEREVRTRNLEDVLQFVEKAVKDIPNRRMARLRANVDYWMTQGKTKAEVLAELNRMLRADLLGGTITHTELKASIQYCLQKFNILPGDETIRQGERTEASGVSYPPERTA
ncbi:MAG: hypothetical protein NZ959_08835 [Armatimonadetes bacterium]|nr:hypothetical protein [Armatimonadota bacterium]MDW8121472.1 hypothetical protein [Armatimonadota bacterium]